MTPKFIEDFWATHNRFLNCTLTTETPNSTTTNLSELCKTDLINAFNLFKQVELDAINSLLQYTNDIIELQKAIATCINDGNKVFIVGCGASARLAVLLRQLYRYYKPNLVDKIISVSSAGDISLIRSIEQFEDSEEFGVKQILQQGFTKHDLLIGLTASGESPFVLAAINYASKLNDYNPWLVCNNFKKDILTRNPNNVASCDNVKVLYLNIGEMALTGSTRLQATTAMQLAVGYAMCIHNINFNNYISNVLTILNKIDLSNLAKITAIESNIIKNGEFILYKTNDNLLGLSMLADITERSPTFNITQFENYSDNNLNISNYSPFYLSLIHTNSTHNAWLNLLGQEPTCLNWEEFSNTSTQYINGFDLSIKSPRINATYLPKPQHNESWLLNNNNLIISINNSTCSYTMPDDFLYQTILYKLLLNSHSTLMFGRLGYYEGNLMLSLKPSNFKLIDRAIRYSLFILKNKYNLNIDYKIVANTLFEEIDKLEPNQSIVKKIVNRIIETQSQ